MDTSSRAASSGKLPSDAGQPRRGFLASAAAVLIGAGALAVPAVLGAIALLNPLRQKGQGGRFFRIASLEVLPEDGTPRKFPVIADRTDAWNRFPNQSIGSMFLRQTGDKEQPIAALSVICPHAGCHICYDADANGYLCPCHTAHFDLSGKRTDAKSQSPRDMDTLDEVEIRNGTEIWVKYRVFRTGIPEKIEKT